MECKNCGKDVFVTFKGCCCMDCINEMEASKDAKGNNWLFVIVVIVVVLIVVFVK